MKNIVKYIYEVFQLKNQVHSGWLMAHVKEPDSVAEHALLAAQIGFILAKEEGGDADKVLRMLVFHDNAETRIGDLNLVNQKYFCNKKEVEKKALQDQLSGLPGDISKGLYADFLELEGCISKEAQIAKDADLLEQAFQARIYQELGNKNIESWMINIGKALKTNSGRSVFKSLLAQESRDWFEELKRR